MSASLPPRVSVILPAYNAEAFLSEAIESVLRQTWHDLELIIVNDGSTDTTMSIAERSREGDRRVRIVDKPNGGPSSARNAGIAAARGDAICFVDADDILLPDKIRRQVEFLERFPGCDLVYSDYYVGDGDLTPVWLVSVRPVTAKIDEDLLYRNFFAPMCPLIRSRLIAVTGGFNEQLRGAEDWEYWIRAAHNGRFCYLPGPVGVYRTHPWQAHHNQDLMRSAGRSVAEDLFPRGTRKWRVLRAARTWAEGQEDLRGGWGVRRLLLAPLKLARSAIIARSPRIIRNVIRWAY